MQFLINLQEYISSYEEGTKISVTRSPRLSKWNISKHLLDNTLKKTVQIFEFPIKFLPSISWRQRFQRIIKIHHNFIQREEIFKHYSILINIHHILLNCSSSLKREGKNGLNNSHNDLFNKYRQMSIINF